MKQTVIALLLAIGIGTHGFAKTDSVLSLDFTYLFTGVLNQGGGIGVKYEHSLGDYFSLRGGFGYMTFMTGIPDIYCTSVNIAVYAYYYPFGKGLDKLYIGIGNGADFMNYFGNGKMPEEKKDTLIFLTPLIGYKLNFLPLMLDLTIGYKCIISRSSNYSEIDYYVNKGIQLGIGFNIHFKEVQALLTKKQ